MVRATRGLSSLPAATASQIANLPLTPMTGNEFPFRMPGSQYGFHGEAENVLRLSLFIREADSEFLTLEPQPTVIVR